MVVVLEPTKYQETECKHFWVIESPSGPTSDGVCRNCGEAREFRNSLPMTRWAVSYTHLPLPTRDLV